MEAINSLKAFLDKSHSVYHATRALEEMLESAGYEKLSERESWKILPGGKYYLTRGGSAVIALRIPKEKPTGFLMSASHSDRPTFKLKENGELTGKYTRLSTEPYGGLILSTWLDRPLSIAGRVLVETETGVESKLVDIDRDLLVIPNVAIHMNRKCNDGMTFNVAVDTLPLVGSEQAAGKLNALLEETAGGKILGHDLYLYLRQQASVWGIEEEYISAAGLDDLQCAFCCAKGFLEAGESSVISVLCVFDSEEVGSNSQQGAAACFLAGVLERICQSLNEDLEQLLGQSFMISADNAHAIHPNHPEYADGNNAPVMNGGVVLKFNASQRYATDGAAAAVLRKICDGAGVPVQTYYNRADLPGGSTLGRISLTQISVPTADIGLAQLAMHSAWETAGAKDTEYLIEAMKAYYSSTLECPRDGSFVIR